MKSTSNTKPSKFTFERYPRGGYILWLRENFSEITETDEYGETQNSWTYDEYTMLVQNPMSDEFIEQHFDEFLSEIKRKEALKVDARILSLESAVNELARIIGGSAE